MTEGSDNTGTQATVAPVANQAWLVALGEAVSFDGYILVIDGVAANYQGLREGQGVLVFDSDDDEFPIIACGRIYRVRSTLEQIYIYLDSVGTPLSPLPLVAASIARTSELLMERLPWDNFDSAVQQLTGEGFDQLPVLKGDSSHEQAYIRELLQTAIADDLLGPANGPYEEVPDTHVIQQYLVGKLSPRRPSADGSMRVEGLEGETALSEEQQNDGELETYTGRHEPGAELNRATGIIDAEGDDAQEGDTANNQNLVPSSLGLTFCVDGDVDQLKIVARWGRYERGESRELINEKTGNPLPAWHRIPSGGEITLPINEGSISPVQVDSECEQVYIQGTVRAPLDNGDRLITLFLVNAQVQPESGPADPFWLFQPELSISDLEGRPVFRRRPVLDANEPDQERVSLEMIYRKQVEFAVGHGVAVHAEVAPDNLERAISVSTTVVPEHEVPITDIPGGNEKYWPANTDTPDRPAMCQMVEQGSLDMTELAEMEREHLASALAVLTDDYELWISEQRSRIGVDVQGYDEQAQEAMAHCDQILARLREGIQVLVESDQALQAFRFANQAMALQRIHSIYALRKRRDEDVTLEALDVRKNRSWRPFQLAFVLLSIPALADPLHPDRTEPLGAYADLLWFPTGGGKTEAYLGVAAFTMGIRRLQNGLGGLDASRGLSVIMRYTLRLLTLQQFQRATTLICAMEVLRRQADEIWGEVPFTIGLWVGNRVTPGKIDDADQVISAIRQGTRPPRGKGTPYQLTSCPWCGSAINPGRDIEVEKGHGHVRLYCSDLMGECDFSRNHASRSGLPAVVVDEELYHYPPSMMIATVDKFAMMAWRGQVRTLFGKASQECERHGLLWPDADCTGNHTRKRGFPRTEVKAIDPIRPPDLIIQDEFHLISGPLGTMVGLYETSVDKLAAWILDGKEVRPKVVASTATVRKAAPQMNNVFMRQAAIFPPHGLDVEDNFFSVQRAIQDVPGRRYMGICSPGSSRPAVLIRVYTALLTASQAIFDRFGEAADPYMTTVGYFNSLRELGGMRRLAEDDVQTRAFRVQMGHVARPGLAQRRRLEVDELTSRVSSEDIPKKLDILEIKFRDDWNAEESRYESRWEKGETRAIDVVLATNMLSVGVDVNRLGLMAVNGQPKGTAEYIQATSRVGRSFPGLVCTVLTWARPRDLSHYETFEHYHATFYKHVEAQSVTPFAPRAMDRGLTGAMVSLMRLNTDDLVPNLGAQELRDTTRPEVSITKGVISDRAWKVSNRPDIKSQAEAMTADRIDRWVDEANRGGRRLGYESERGGGGDIAGLLEKPGIQSWTPLTVPMSMREVEPGVRLILDDRRITQNPEWRPRPPASSQDSEGEE